MQLLIHAGIGLELIYISKGGPVVSAYSEALHKNYLLVTFSEEKAADYILFDHEGSMSM